MENNTKRSWAGTEYFKVARLIQKMQATLKQRKTKLAKLKEQITPEELKDLNKVIGDTIDLEADLTAPVCDCGAVSEFNPGEDGYGQHTADCPAYIKE